MKGNLRYVYWGEYPLAFAACLGQEECYRLMLAKGANPNLQDTNGNTVLHMLVIYDKIVTNKKKQAVDEPFKKKKNSSWPSRTCSTWPSSWARCSTSKTSSC